MTGEGVSGTSMRNSTPSWGALKLLTRVTPPTQVNNAPLAIVLPCVATTVVIGRRPGCDVVINNPCISGTHCIVSRQQSKSVCRNTDREPPSGDNEECTDREDLPQKKYRQEGEASAQPSGKMSEQERELLQFDFTIADCSTNGCYVNGEFVGKGNVRSIKHGDTIELVRAATDRADRYNLSFVFDANDIGPDDVSGGQEPNEGGTPPTSGVVGAEVSDVSANAAEAIVACPPVVDMELREVDEELVVQREPTVEYLRKRHASDIELFYSLNKTKPLGEGSFAKVYEATLKLDAGNATLPVLKLFDKTLTTVPSDDALAKMFMFHRTFAVKVINKTRILLPHETQDSQDGDVALLADPFTVQQRHWMRQLIDDDAEGASSTTEQRRAIFAQLTPENRKVVEREIKSKQRQQREIDILMTVSHYNIVRLFEIFESPTKLCFVMELAESGELFPLVSSLGSLPEFYVKIVVYQLLQGVLYLHQMGIAHRDIKLENVLLSKATPLSTLCKLQRDAAIRVVTERQASVSASGCSSPIASALAPVVSAVGKRDRFGVLQPPQALSIDSVKSTNSSEFRSLYHSHVFLPLMWWPRVMVSDFGLSRALHHGGLQQAEGTPGLMSTMCGTPLYAAPEVTIQGLRETRCGYTEAVDLFSVGVLCFAMLCGRPPFPTARDAHDRPQKGKMDYSVPLHWDRKAGPQAPTNRSNASGGDVEIADVPYVAVSAAARDFVSRLLKVRPTERMTAAEALQHPWMAEVKGADIDLKGKEEAQRPQVV